MRDFWGILLCIMTFSQAALSAVADSTEIRFGNANYFRSGENYFGSDRKSENMSSASVLINSQSSKQDSKHAVNLEALYSLPEDTGYLNLKEVYFDFGKSEQELVLGRKIYSWSEADEEWQTGFWQPMFKWDGLRPEANGLFAGFWRDQLTKDTKALIFISPLHAPTMGPTVREKDGRLSSQNPWFRPPPDSTTFYGAQTDVYSGIEKPETKDVIFNPGIGARIDSQINSTKAWGVAYAYKPVPQLFVSYDYKLIAATSGGGIDLTFHPWVAYHHLATMDYTEEHRKSGFNLAMTYEHPTRTDNNEDRVYPRLPDSYVASFLMHRNISGEGPSAFKVYGGLIRHWGGIAADGGPAATEGSAFELRPRYIAALKAGVKYPVWSRWRRLMNRVEVNYDAAVRGGTFLTELEIPIDQGWIASVSYDMIGVFAEPPEKYKNSFVNTYRANDRAMVRLSYVY